MDLVVDQPRLDRIDSKVVLHSYQEHHVVCLLSSYLGILYTQYGVFILRI